MKMKLNSAPNPNPARKSGADFPIISDTSIEAPAWCSWAGTLKDLGLSRIVAAFLESAGSLTEILAQGIYITQPLLSIGVSTKTSGALASLLENPENTRQFINMLSKDAS